MANQAAAFQLLWTPVAESPRGLRDAVTLPCPRSRGTRGEDDGKLLMRDRRGMNGPQDVAESVLLARTAAGDEEAFEALFRRFERPLYAYFVRMLQDESAAEELVCETMAAVWRGARGFRGESQPSTWIFGIAHRLALGALRRRRPAASLEEVEQELPAQTPDPEEAAARADVGQRVRQALTTLSAEHREVMELTFFHGKGYPEIARVLGIPVNTVKTRMFYARQKLRAALEKVGITDAI